MKKRILLITLAVLLLTLLAGCGCDHVWEDATCEEPKTCSECGETEGKALGHEWKDATCEAPKTCEACGETEGEALGHQLSFTFNLDNYQKMTGTCATCGHTQEEDMDWEVVANDIMVGSWTCETVAERSTGEESSLTVPMTMEVREDGTATIDMDGEIFELTWAYDELTYPYGEGVALVVVWYEYTFDDGGVSPGYFLLMQEYSGVDNPCEFYLLVGELAFIFTK